MIREPGYVFRRLHIVLHHVHIDVESDILACLEAAPVLDKYHELLWDNVLIREGHKRFLQISLIELVCYRGPLII